MLCLFFTTFFNFAAFAHKGHKTKKKFVEAGMTVAKVRPANNEETFITIIFQQSARFYKIPKDSNPAFLELLKDSEKNKTEVLIKRADEASDIILGVRKK
jgi:hypothetical protein